MRLSRAKFRLDLNPFGILFNPISIANSLDMLLHPDSFTEDYLFSHRGLWHSFLHHGSFSQPEKEDIYNTIQLRLQKSHDFLREADLAILTFGSAHVYLHLDKNLYVANCHKLPNQLFAKQLSALSDLQSKYEDLLGSIFDYNHDIKILLSVSPVRYVRDGAIQNQRSKARLLLLCEHLIQKYPQVEYFPAYELVIDDLRGYQFYESDLVHPNGQAIEYVWKKFVDLYFDRAARTFADKMMTLQKELSHRAIHPQSKAEQQRLQLLLSRIEAIEAEYDFCHFTLEKARLRERLK